MLKSATSTSSPADTNPEDTTATHKSRSNTDWRRHMREAFRNTKELCEFLDINPEIASLPATDSFPLFAPRPFVARMRPGDPNDPLLRQVLPVAAENQAVEGFSSDPLQEASFQPAAGLLRKYGRRVLLVTTGACAIHCRYCFRRNFSYENVPNSLDDWTPALEAIEAAPEIDEVILSGGDPLTLVDETLSPLMNALDQIQHVARIRIHTRLPIMIPDRVNLKLLDLIDNLEAQTVFVLHANHSSEIDHEVIDAITRLRNLGIPLLNQSVLLQGVNNSADQMEALCRQLVNIGVLPYYLHQLDRVEGAAHFEVPKLAGKRIIEELAKRLPGYAVPRFVEEIPGESSKSRIL